VLFRSLLWHIPDLGQGASVGHFIAEDICLAAAQLEQAAEYLDNGGLARAVGTEQPVDNAVLDFEVQLAQRRKRPEPLGQVLCLNGERLFQVSPS